MLPFIIEKIQIQNFRNIENTVINFVPSINCIFGENGNGKTNILEALYYLIKRKSFRKNTAFPQILSIDGEKNEILFQSLFKNTEDGKKINYSGRINTHQSSWYLENKSTNRKLKVGIIFISPFDSYAFHTSPISRRSWVDEYLGQFDQSYRPLLKRYNKALRFRNKLLSTQAQYLNEQIEAIDKEMAPLSLIITQKRTLFLEQLRPHIKKAFHDLFSENHELEIILDTKMNPQNVQSYFDLAKSNKQKDIALGYTHYGIHKDDYILLFDGLNSYDYCSLGQQKMSYLSLLFAYIELFRYKFKAFPIVLLDDLSGELDKLRWSHLVNYIRNRKFQILITTANNNFKKLLDDIEEANKIQVISGIIESL